MHRYQVRVVEHSSTIYYADVEAPDEEAAKALAVGMVEEFEETGVEPDGLRESGIGLEDPTVEVSAIDGVLLGFDCMDCGVNTSSCGGNGEYPLMLRDEVWRSIVPDGKGMLCRADMERRLGRPLDASDFPG